MVRVWRSGDQLLVAAGQGSGAGAVLWVVLLAFAFVAAIVFSCAEGMKAKGSAARTSGGGHVARHGGGHFARHGAGHVARHGADGGAGAAGAVAAAVAAGAGGGGGGGGGAGC